jgi:Tol biopolymer transport system component
MAREFVSFVMIVALVSLSSCRKSVEPETPLNIPHAHIVFVSNRATEPYIFQVFIMDEDGTHVQRLTHDSNNYFFPRFSPDGKSILFYSQNRAENNIYRIDITGENFVNVSNCSGNNILPQFSPDGSKIVFTSDRDGNREIYIMNSDGSQQTRLTRNTITDHSPQFSPDGERIIFYSTFNNYVTPESYTMYSIEIDGSNLTQLTPDSAYFHFSTKDNTQHVLDAAPRYSPDGSKIVFQTYYDYGRVINIIDADGSHRKLLVYYGGDEAAPFFSPNGSQILFRSHRTGDFDLYRLNLTDGKETVITSDNGHTMFGDFSSDGSKILYYSAIDEKSYEYWHIYSANADGSGRKKLTSGEFGDYYPAFQPIR